jgi:hypothetical protein
VEYILCETFKAANVLILDTIDGFSAKSAYFVAVKDHSRSDRFNTEVVTEMAKTAAARFGKIKPRRPRHQLTSWFSNLQSKAGLQLTRAVALSRTPRSQACTLRVHVLVVAFAQQG